MDREWILKHSPMLCMGMPSVLCQLNSGFGHRRAFLGSDNVLLVQVYAPLLLESNKSGKSLLVRVYAPLLLESEGVVSHFYMP